MSKLEIKTADVSTKYENIFDSPELKIYDLLANPEPLELKPAGKND